jgi:hypothetical protein
MIAMPCGKAGCACKDKKNPKKHGPYPFWRRWQDGKQKLTYLKASDGEIQVLLRAYQAYQQLLARYRKLAKEMDAVLVKARDLYVRSEP